MTRDETKRILMIVASTYSNFKPDNMSMTLDVWTQILAEYSYKDVEKSLISYIASSNSGFAPSVSQLIGGVHKITNNLPQYDNEEEAWSLVYKAINRSTYYSVEEYNKLPAICQKAIGSPDNLRELAQADLDSIQTVEKSNFMRVYRAEKEKQEEHDRIPTSVKQQFGLEERLYNQLALETRTDDIQPRISEDMKETTLRALQELKDGNWR